VQLFGGKRQDCKGLPREASEFHGVDFLAVGIEYLDGDAFLGDFDLSAFAVGIH
jgi:hypothetical protein